jgi:hypothetical protein
MTNAEFDKKLSKVLKDNPTELILWMLVQMGKTVLETGAGSMDLKTEATLEKQRYQVKAKITLKKVNT